MNDAKQVSLACAILTVSDSRSAGDDTSGNMLAESLAHAGHMCVRRDLVKKDLYQIRRVISEWIADPAVQVILVSGGTGFTPRDCTAQAIEPLFDKTIEGFGELFRQLSYEEIGSSAVQSSALAGTANDTVIFCMPGSNHACKLGWNRIIREQLDDAHKPCNFAMHYRAKPDAD
ncbi:molybdenum cofactor biosynthesis protein B [Bordetella parapertussis]|uniref:Molybdenum cofactor biosynthesis protein B n=4 Tax=Bordetella TaxID=517 RepID=K0MA11_BORPB|nr:MULTISPECIES: molybdenum cofactor biosynthesis protein B [Bordetella]KAK66065.1 molybdenum cofactor biosynthesis protein B [Bordetella bronchiseptica 980-2]AMG87766.1 molybdenum cofactor biosynthesis protein B [Bordetella bronchiseptica]AOB38372.1 molybdenum cofactor biosynthesis protein B [Bordetella parapertussis]AUL42351.1 molybdenum cofactor biosynthesis protein B [Bordetella parapertussis]AWP62263.1 molybdenum cofactor biosynthesis protein [Bordetella parapertussis]